MSLKFSFLFLSALLLINSSFSQQAYWSAPIKSEKNLNYLKIIGSIGDQFYLLQSNYPFESTQSKMSMKNQRYSLSCYSENMALNWTKQLQVPGTGARILDIQIINEKLLIAYSEISKTNFMHFYVQHFSESGNLEGLAIRVDSINARVVENSSNPRLLVSKNEELLALAYRLVATEDSHQKFRVAILSDSSLQTSQAEIVINIGEQFFNPVDIALSDSGDIHLLGFCNLSEKKSIQPGDTYLQLYSYWENVNNTTNTDIRFADKLLTDAGLVIDNLNNTIAVAGFYSDRSLYSTAGVFLFTKKWGSESVGELKSAPFSENFLKKFIGEKKESDRELINYSIDRILLRKDGGVVLVAESYSSTSRSYYDYFTQSLISHTYYHYGNIISLSLNTDGNFLWSNVLTKDQNSTDDGGSLSSYCSLIYNAKMYFVYNKYIEAKSSVMVGSVTSKGEQNTAVLFNELDKITLIPKAGKQVEQNVLLLPAYKDKQLCLLKIIF